jgi:hypothetical protein
MYFKDKRFTPDGSEINLILLASGGQLVEDESNTDYQQYLAWLAEGNTPEPWEAQ